MFIFELSDLKKNKIKLPPINNWLNPNYPGKGNVFFDQYLMQNHLDPEIKSINLPKNFQKDFPEYCYTFPDLIKLKNELNKTKNLLNPINSNPEKSVKFEKISKCFRSYDLLRGKWGILSQKYGAEIVTNAWLKMYENMTLVKPYLEKIKQFNTFHIAEAPGNFILAINHYLKTNYPNIEWNWIASTYKDLYQNGQDCDYLGDTYGLIRNYPDQWYFGCDLDGDITSPENIISFKQEILKKFKGKLDLITSDVKYVPGNMNFSEEENYNIPVHFGHLLSSLMCLSPGGIMILKEFTFFESGSVSLLFLMSYCFEKILVVKPQTSRAANSEVYLFGMNYKDNLSELQIVRLLKVMRYIRNLNSEIGSPSLFLKSNIPNDFLEKVEEFSEKLTQMQIPSILKNIEIFQDLETRNIPIEKFCKDLTRNQEQIASEWIKQNDIKKLDPEFRLIKK